MHKKIFVIAIAAALILAVSPIWAVYVWVPDVNVTFQVDMRYQPITTGDTVGIRGNRWPLTWDESFVLTDPDSDSIYTGTVNFSGTLMGCDLSYKFVYGAGTNDSVIWEGPLSTGGGYRRITIPSTDMILPVVYFADVDQPPTTIDVTVTFNLSTEYYEGSRMPDRIAICGGVAPLNWRWWGYPDGEPPGMDSLGDNLWRAEVTFPKGSCPYVWYRYDPHDDVWGWYLEPIFGNTGDPNSGNRLLYIADETPTQILPTDHLGWSSIFTPREITVEECNTAIENGLAWLAANQHPDGYWTSQGYRVGPTGHVVLAFENQGHLPTGNAAVDPYVTLVREGLDYLFENAQIQDIDSQPAGNPDTDGDGIGIRFGNYFEQGMAMSAIVQSAAPKRVVDVPGSNVDGWTYKEVIQDAVDYVAYAQNEIGNGRGGWSHGPNEEYSHNTGSPWVVLGLHAAEAWRVDIPEFVRSELSIWIDYIQNDESGGSGYTTPDGTNICRTGGLLIEQAFCGDTKATPRVQAAIDYIGDNWIFDGGHVNCSPMSYYSMYEVANGFRLFDIEYISPLDDSSGLDWYNSFAIRLVDGQNNDGSWGPGQWSDNPHATAWAVLVLSPYVFLVNPPMLIQPNSCAFTNDNTPTFVWTKPRGARMYHIQVDDESTFSDPLVIDALKAFDTTYTPTTPLNEGQFYWRVRASDGSGNWSPWATAWCFTVDTSPPVFTRTTMWTNTSFQGLYPVSSTITDALSGADSFLLHFRFEPDTLPDTVWYTCAMQLTTLNTHIYIAQIPEVADTNTMVYYYLQAKDSANNIGLDPEGAPDSVYSFFGLWTGIAELISPPNAVCINDSTPSFDWTDAACATGYHIQVDDDSTFSSPVIDDSTLTESVYTTTTALTEGFYYWRVRASTDSGNWLVWTQAWNFTIDTQVPSAPVLVYPDSASAINESQTTFIWNASTDNLCNIDFYILEYGDNPQFSDADSVQVTDTVYTLPSVLPDSIYYWHVKAVDAATNQSDWSHTWSFILDTQPPIFSGTTVQTDTSSHGPYPISSAITDALSGADSAFLWYSFDAGVTWDNVVMQLTQPNTYNADIPQVPDTNTTVQYCLKATDLAANVGYDPAGAPDTFYSFVGGANYTQKLGIAEHGKIPTDFVLCQNLPNPFTLATTIHYQLPIESEVSLRIYDCNGQLVRILENSAREAGYYTVAWDGRDNRGKKVTSGVYFYKIRTRNYTKTKKMILLN